MLYPEKISPDDLLKELRWHADMVITNYDGDRVWLKDCYDGLKKAGITDCCLESDPCEWHKDVKRCQNNLGNQNQK